MKPLILFLSLFLPGGAGVDDRIDVNTLEKEDLAPFVQLVEAKGVGPVSYLVEKCRQKKVVFLGETHWVRENCLLVADALGPLYREAGVRLLATEFLRSRFNDRMKTILTAPEYDEAAVVEMMRAGPWSIWGFREYEEIFRAAWRLNRGLPGKAEPLLVVGLDSDWSQYDLWFELKDRRKKFEMRLGRERHMAGILERAAFAGKKRTLVHVGAAHAILCHGLRLGTVLYKKYPDRIFQIHLHSKVPAGRGLSRLTGFLESLHARAGGKPVGFDVLGTPLAPLHDPKSLWARALPEGRFSDFARGYILLAPLDRLHRVNWIHGFITRETFPRALAVCEKCGWTKKGECKEPGELDRVLAERFAGGLAAAKKKK